MKAMIFAAGLGTRLRPLTDTMPKALVSVGGVPMLQRVLCKLRDAGIDSFVVNVHHFAEQIAGTGPPACREPAEFEHATLSFFNYIKMGNGRYCDR